MTYTGYYSNQDLRFKLGNTIAGNFNDGLLENARRFGDDTIDFYTHKPSTYQDGQDANVKHGWIQTDRYFGTAKGISMEFATAWLRTTQINVSIQALREWERAVKLAESLYLVLVSEGLIQQTGRFATDSYVTEVLNPVDGTIVTGLRGIVRARRLGSIEDQMHQI